MGPSKSLDEHKLIAALLCDVQQSHGLVFNHKSLRLTLRKVESRLSAEGIGFLTKSLPRLGKAFDKALSGGAPLNSASLGFKSQVASELPRFLGEFFSRVLHPDGTVLQDPCANSVQVIRCVTYWFYKYETSYTSDQEQTVVDRFKKTEDDLDKISTDIAAMHVYLDSDYKTRPYSCKAIPADVIVRKARYLLTEVFAKFDPTDIVPSHGPGAVSTRERLWEKWHWSNVSDRITSLYPLDAYFYANLGHVCDRLQEIQSLTTNCNSARVLLVPKDSRGPRLISCEPLDYMWIQQGLGRAIVRHVENLELTKFNVFFTDQGPNRRGAQLGSSNGRYATLDLNEASDRVSLELVRLLFPPRIAEYLEACRSLTTVLPSGEVLALKKFAPMGSALCFPVLALTTWAILTAGAPDTDTREGILVYGDDVIVPTAQAANAIEQLESFGLKVNRDKSCTGGFFRESCGMDAFKGVDVTPVRLRTVWSSEPSPEVYTSWIAYANSMYDRSYFRVYELIADALIHVYGSIPAQDKPITRQGPQSGTFDGIACPCLRRQPDAARPLRRRWNKNYQKFEYHVLMVRAPIIHKVIDGWEMLLRYFIEAHHSTVDGDVRWSGGGLLKCEEVQPFSVGSYTKRGTSLLVRRWR